MARNFQTIITASNLQKPMKMSFSTEEAARNDIARTLVSAERADLAALWGRILTADLVNKLTQETVRVYQD